jgi:glutamine amidotransferase
MITKAGGKASIESDPTILAKAEKIILPGVGAFDHGMSLLQNNGWVEALNEAVIGKSTPILGICLGMQLMCNSSEEGNLFGLGWVDAEVKKILIPNDENLKIPHMGWNTVDIAKPNPLISTNDGETRFYFVHSYHVVCNNHQDILATTYYGMDITAAFSQNNVYGTQFHPEKSHRFGMDLMKNFIDL